MAFSTEVNSAGIRKHLTQEFFKFYIRITKSDKTGLSQFSCTL